MQRQVHVRARRWGIRLTVFWLWAVVAACASEGDRLHPFAQGWVEARVTQIDGPLHTPLTPADDCRQADAGSAFRYAEVDFWWRGFSRRRIARLPREGTALRDGDFVYVNLLDCGLPLAPNRR